MSDKLLDQLSSTLSTGLFDPTVEETAARALRHAREEIFRQLDGLTAATRLMTVTGSTVVLRQSFHTGLRYSAACADYTSKEWHETAAEAIVDLGATLLEVMEDKESEARTALDAITTKINILKGGDEQSMVEQSMVPVGGRRRHRTIERARNKIGKARAELSQLEGAVATVKPKEPPR